MSGCPRLASISRTAGPRTVSIFNLAPELRCPTVAEGATRPESGYCRRKTVQSVKKPLLNHASGILALHSMELAMGPARSQHRSGLRHGPLL